MRNLLRQYTPLLVRQKIGPYVGYAAYWYRTRLVERTWEPTVLSPTETLKKVYNEQLSVIRFGDGELSLIAGEDLAFQKHEDALAKKLREIITVDQPNLLICIPGIFNRLEHFSSTGFWFEIHHLFRYGSMWRELTIPNRIYGEALITRPYLSYRNKINAGERYLQLKQLWADRNVLLLEGEKSRVGVGNDLLSGAQSLRRILGPAENAFGKSGAIIEKVLDVANKNDLILLSLGPAAKVIGFELFTRGYHVLDIGHLDMEYEMFLMNSTRLVPVRYKYFNEISMRDPEICDDEEYQSEIIATFL